MNKIRINELKLINLSFKYQEDEIDNYYKLEKDSLQQDTHFCNYKYFINLHSF